MRIRLILLCLLITCLCSGCGKWYTVRNDEPKNREWVQPEPKFELSQYQVALLYNGGLKKSVLRASTGDTFTIVLPKFHNSSYTFGESPVKTGFHFTIIPPGTYYDEDGKQTGDYIVRTFDYVKAEDVDIYDTNVYRQRVLQAVLPEDEYPSKQFETYEEYVAAYTERVNSIFVNTVDTYSTLELTGELLPVKGRFCTDGIVIDDVRYNLPFSTVYFQLSNGNRLYIRTSLVSSKAADLFDAVNFRDKLVSPFDKVKNKDKKAVVDFLTGLELDFTDGLSDLLPGVIYGDFSEYYKPVKITVSGNNSPVEKDEPEQSKDESVEKEEDIEIFGSPENTYKELLKEGVKKSDPTKASTIINGFEDQDTFGGYDDYDIDGGDYTYEN